MTERNEIRLFTKLSKLTDKGDYELLIEPTIIIIVLAVITTIFWIYADKIYQSHYKTKKDHPFLFKILGWQHPPGPRVFDKDVF